MPQGSGGTSLWNALSGLENLTNSCLHGVEVSVELTDLKYGSALDGRGEELRGGSVLIATTDQLIAALALIELDGIARRVVLCPADLPLEHLPLVMKAAELDAIVTDRSILGPNIPEVRSFITCDASIVPGQPDRHISHQTEWVLLTSGTTGLPKLALHTLASLSGAIQYASTPSIVWATFYDIRRYGGLQIFLRAMLSGAALVLSNAKESVADYLTRAGSHGVTHISGTPSHWRNELMSPAADKISPQYIRLSGEIADQGILNQLRAFYPQARISHAFASTEAGVAFDVTDGLAGFPAKFIEQPGPGVEMKVEDGSLRIRSSRNAARYIGASEKLLKCADGFVDTGDMIELRDDRYYFVGRRDGVINVGGLKVHPEEVEAVINRHPLVRMCLVHTRKNAITGALVVADVVLDKNPSAEPISGLRQEIIQLCRDTLARHKVPAMINFVPTLTVAETGKMARQYA